MNGLFRVSRLIVAMVVVLLSISAVGQEVRPRLQGAISGTDRVKVAGSVSPRVPALADEGAVSDETKVSGVTLVFRRSEEQEAELQELLRDQQDPKSAQYHTWLTPDAFAARFGIAAADIQKVENWLTARGFEVERVSRSRDRVTFSGSAAQVQEAFGTELHRYRVGDDFHVSPASDVILPSNLAGMTTAVLHLSDFRPKANVRAFPQARPEFTSYPGQQHYLVPYDVEAMYGLLGLPPMTYFGKGQRIAVVGQSYVNLDVGSPVQQFSAYLGGGQPVTPILVPGSGVEAISPGDESESELDVEYAAAIAGYANVYLVHVGSNQNYDITDALAFAIDQNLAQVISVSYSICEAEMSTSELAAGNALLEQAAAQGQTVVAASGDSGSTACAAYRGLPANEQQSLAVNFPADSPYVVAVGGTQLAPGTFAAGSSSYWGSANYIDNSNSLLSYVPEVVWNEGSQANGIVASGGGASTYFARPGWQSGIPGMPAGSYRLVPDIALEASLADPGYLVCTDDAALLSYQGQTSSCSNRLAGSNGKYTVAGGTSFATPIFAAFVATINSVLGVEGQGNINPVLYGIASKPASYSVAFHDISTGTNACSAGSGSCGVAGESGFSANAGYDQATGLGSVDVAKLAAAWPAVNPLNLIGTTTGVNGSTQITAQPGSSVPLYIVVTSEWPTTKAPPTPTGNLSISVDGTVLDAALPFSSGMTYAGVATVTYNLTVPTTAGSHVVIINYLGDSAHAPSAGTYVVVVGSEMATGSVTLAANNLTVTNESSAGTQVTITPAGGYNGQVTWSLAGSGPSALTFCYLINSVAVSGVTTTPITIGTGTYCSSAAPAGALRVPGSGVQGAVVDQGNQRGGNVSCAAMCFGVLFLGLLPRRRGRWVPALVGTLCVAGMLNLSGCGGGSQSSNSSGGPGTDGTKQTSYTMTLTGRDSVNSAISATTVFTLTVK